MRREQILRSNEPKFAHYAEGSTPEEDPPRLFGDSFKDKLKKLVKADFALADAVKTVRSWGSTSRGGSRSGNGTGKRPFFRGAPTQERPFPGSRWFRFPQQSGRGHYPRRRTSFGAPNPTSQRGGEQLLRRTSPVSGSSRINRYRQHVVSCCCSSVIPVKPPFAARLSLYLNTWLSITTDRWILEAVEGLSLDFLSPPHQQNCRRSKRGPRNSDLWCKRNCSRCSRKAQSNRSLRRRSAL